MKTHMRLLSPGLFTLALALSISPAAHAVLGGAASTVQMDHMRMKATVPAATGKLNYTVHEMTVPSGTVVREYIADDKVFAVTWRGPHVPDLKQLMGTYFDTYRNEAQTHRSGHNHLAIEHPEFVMHASGHMRAYTGSAYLPSMLPAGVTANDIQ